MKSVCNVPKEEKPIHLEYLLIHSLNLIQYLLFYIKEDNVKIYQRPFYYTIQIITSHQIHIYIQKEWGGGRERERKKSTIVTIFNI